MKESGTSRNKTFRQYNLVFKGLTQICIALEAVLLKLHIALQVSHMKLHKYREVGHGHVIHSLVPRPLFWCLIVQVMEVPQESKV